MRPVIFKFGLTAALDGVFSEVDASTWKYRWSENGTVFEFALWDGNVSPQGRPHFHEEAQFVIVLEGQRDFFVQTTECRVERGHCLYIPPRQLHHSIHRLAPPTRCLNLYVQASEIPRVYNALCDASVEPVVTGARSHPARLSSVVDKSLQILLTLTDSVLDMTALAQSQGYSREGFSRKFSKELGVGPAAYSLLIRLNRAKALLREGCPVALAAIECGFADQSHLGRHFLKTFGTTPAQYSRGSVPVTFIPDIACST